MKQLWFWGVVGLVLGFGLFAQPSQAAYAPIEGAIIKTSNNNAVYYIGDDDKRYLYVNESTFWTWYSGSWSNIQENGVTKTIKVLSQKDFDNLSFGGNATVKPGMKLIKFNNSPKIYSVVSEGKLALVPDDATAEILFGDDWNQDVITLQNGFETNYTKDGILDLTTTEHKMRIVNESSYNISDLSLTLVGGEEIDSTLENISLGSGDATEYYKYNLIKPVSGQATVGIYGCYSGNYTQNNEDKTLLVCSTISDRVVSIKINNIDHTFKIERLF